MAGLQYTATSNQSERLILFEHDIIKYDGNVEVS